MIIGPWSAPVVDPGVIRACTGADLRALLAGVSWRKHPDVWCFSTGFVTHFRFLRHETLAESLLKTADHVIIITTSWWFKKFETPVVHALLRDPLRKHSYCYFGHNNSWAAPMIGNKCKKRVKISGYLARARARARPALVKRGASGPCPKKCLKIFLHRARVHDMCIFSSISFFYFISIFNICSIVCIPFNLFFLSTRSPIFYWGKIFHFNSMYTSFQGSIVITS